MQTMPPLSLPPVPPAEPSGPLGHIMFAALAGIAVAAAAIWALARIGAARRRVLHFPAGFAAASGIFGIVYALNRAALPLWPGPAAAADILLLGAMLGLPYIRTGSRRIRLRKARNRRSLRLRGPVPGRAWFSAFKTVRRRALSPVDLRIKIEVANLENMLKLDPDNTFCLEKLSELYEKTGRPQMALDAARAAAGQDPSVRNKWRVSELEEKFGRR